MAYDKAVWNCLLPPGLRAAPPMVDQAVVGPATTPSAKRRSASVVS
jgi:hypothetical protein